MFIEDKKNSHFEHLEAFVLYKRKLENNLQKNYAI